MRRVTAEKQHYRFIVIDDTIKTWGVLDRKTNTIVFGEFRSPMEARMKAEELNLNPGLIDDKP